MELLIRVADKINPDFYKNCKCTKRGDVIEVLPDGSNWGTLTLLHTFYRIVRVDISDGDAQALLAPEPDADMSNPSQTLQARAFNINLDDSGLPPEFSKFMADDTRQTPILLLSLDAMNSSSRALSETFSENIGNSGDVVPFAPLDSTKFLSLKTRKTPIADPNVIGDAAPNVIG